MAAVGKAVVQEPRDRNKAWTSLNMMIDCGASGELVICGSQWCGDKWTVTI